MGSWFGSVFGSGCLCVSDLRLYVFRNSVIGFGSFVIRCDGVTFLWLCRLALLQLRCDGVMLSLVSFCIVVHTLMLSCMSGM